MPETTENSSRSKFGSVATFASGLIVGVVVAPYIKKAVKNFSPDFDEAADKIAKVAGSTIEKASDLMAEAKEKIKN